MQHEAEVLVLVVELRVRPELPGPGEPVRTMVSREGRAYLPKTQDAKLRFCAP